MPLRLESPTHSRLPQLLVTVPLLPSRLLLSTFTLAVSAGAVLLLPFSIVSNEVLLSFPHSYYIQWLNGSLIHGQYVPVCVSTFYRTVLLGFPFTFCITDVKNLAER